MNFPLILYHRLVVIMVQYKIQELILSSLQFSQVESQVQQQHGLESTKELVLFFILFVCCNALLEYPRFCVLIDDVVLSSEGVVL